MAKLMADSKAGSAALNYNFTVETDPSNATAALVNGTADIAALPTNAAAALYNKTDGAVQVLALNTRGVLYVVTDGTENITSFADLRGKTRLCPRAEPDIHLPVPVREKWSDRRHGHHHRQYLCPAGRAQHGARLR